VDDAERTVLVEQLLAKWSDAKARRRALAAEAEELGAMIKDIRAAFGNPFFYSGKTHGRPENAEQSIEKFTGSDSHAVVAPTIFRLLDVGQELKSIREQLQKLGVSVD